MTTQPIRTLVCGPSTPHFFLFNRVLFISFSAHLALCRSLISQARWEQEDGAALTPGPPLTTS